MPKFSDAIRDVLARLAQLLGLKPSEGQRMERIADKLAGDRARNVDQLEEIKGEIRALEGRALKKSKELEQVKGETRRIIAGEIERSFRDLDRLRGKETILVRNIDKISLALSKVQELKAARLQGADESQLDELTLEVEQSYGELRTTDKAARSLERTRYEPPEASPVDIEQRMGEVQGTRERTDELSPQARQRLKELEEE